MSREPEPEPKPGQGFVATRSLWPLLFIVSVVALVAVVSFGAGIVAERRIFGGPWLSSSRLFSGVDTDGAAEVDNAYPHLAEVRSLIKDEYFFLPENADAQATFWADLDQGAMTGLAIAAATPAASLEDFQRQLDYGAARGLAEAAPDDYTVFLEPLIGEPLREELAGKYEGIGIWVEHPEGRFTIVSPIAGSPADRAGLQPGDVIVAADGQRLDNLDTDAAMSLIRGPAGTSVNLTIERPGKAEPFQVTVQREAIVIPAVVYTPMDDGKVAHIAVSIFGDNTTSELDAALRRAKEEQVSGIVLDLRGNGGGWVTSAQEMVGRFVPVVSGVALYQDLDVKDDGDLIEEPIVGGGETDFNTPLVVLVDGGTASAAEIVAGALRDYDRAVLVGQPTFGKGLVQRVHDFPDGSSARITFARWLTPDKHPIPEDGLRPDVLVAVGPEATEADGAAVDAQLDRAVELVDAKTSD
ncbi:MAG: S41 family peptidase [Thermomicrobiales bacterium]